MATTRITLGWSILRPQRQKARAVSARGVGTNGVGRVKGVRGWGGKGMSREILARIGACKRGTRAATRHDAR
eukprot:6169106-Pleurochrysis_carterae.AAC.1